MASRARGVVTCRDLQVLSDCRRQLYSASALPTSVCVHARARDNGTRKNMRAQHARTVCRQVHTARGHTAHRVPLSGHALRTPVIETFSYAIGEAHRCKSTGTVHFIQRPDHDRRDQASMKIQACTTQSAGSLCFARTQAFSIKIKRHGLHARKLVRNDRETLRWGTERASICFYNIREHPMQGGRPASCASHRAKTH